MALSDTLRENLGKDATRYELLSAAPSPHMQQVIWITWSALAGVVGILTLIFFLGILSSPKARGRSFNVYVLFITFPDMFFSICCSVTCGLNAAAGRYYSERGCSFQTFYTIFAFASNAWLNAVICRQVHIMLRSSYQRKRYKPPPIRVVCGHAAAVYCYAAFIASMTLWGTSVLRHSDARGLACLPVEHDVRSSLFFWLFYFWFLIGIPLVYVTYVLFDVKRRGLLPPGGRTRSVALFFARITIVFVIMWLPTMVAIYMANRMAGVWFGFIGGIWSHLQPIVSASVACMKGDIKEAVYNFITCRWCDAMGQIDTTADCSDGDDDEEGRQKPQSPHSNIANASTSKRTTRARRSSVFNSFLGWRSTPNTTSGTSTPRKASAPAPLPPISSSGMTSDADRSRPSFVDEDVLIHKEDTAAENKGKEEEKEEEFSACRDNSV